MVPPWMFGIMKSLTVLRPKLVLYITSSRVKTVLDNVVLQVIFYLFLFNKKPFLVSRAYKETAWPHNGGAGQYLLQVRVKGYCY